MKQRFVPTTLKTEFRCALCEKTQPVDFNDPAAYAEPDPLPNKSEWVQKAALKEAETRLQKRAQAAMQLARCPNCHRRDEALVRRALLRAAAPLIGLAPGLFMLGVI